MGVDFIRKNSGTQGPSSSSGVRRIRLWFDESSDPGTVMVITVILTDLEIFGNVYAGPMTATGKNAQAKFRAALAHLLRPFQYTVQTGGHGGYRAVAFAVRSSPMADRASTPKEDTRRGSSRSTSSGATRSWECSSSISSVRTRPFARHLPSSAITTPIAATPIRSCRTSSLRSGSRFG